MTKNPPYSRRLIRWFCDCGKEHASEALAWACECYGPVRQAKQKVKLRWCECGYLMPAKSYMCLKCGRVEVKEVGDANA